MASRGSLNLQESYGPAWLLLSHGAFLAVMANASSFGISFLVANPESSTANSRPVGLVWCSISLAVGIFMIYAIAKTWKANKKTKNQVFGDEGFVLLMLIVLASMGATIFTIVEVALAPT